MFIPSETIYYDLLTNKSGSVWLLEYAFKEKKVIIVSPTSFYAYLQTVLQWLKALVIEQKAKDIAKQVSKLARHLEVYEQTFEKLGNSLGTTVNHYNNSYKEFRKIDKDIVKITWEKTKLEKEPTLIDKPE
jgi:DNA recombination protein RmuC